MFKFLKTLVSSHNFIDRLAERIGVDRKIYRAGLTEARVNFAMYEQMYELSKADMPRDADRILFFAYRLLQPAYQGVSLIQRRFPEQESLATCLRQLEAFKSEVDESGGLTDLLVLDDDDAKPDG